MGNKLNTDNNFLRKHSFSSYSRFNNFKMKSINTDRRYIIWGHDKLFIDSVIFEYIKKYCFVSSDGKNIIKLDDKPGFSELLFENSYALYIDETFNGQHRDLTNNFNNYNLFLNQKDHMIGVFNELLDRISDELNIYAGLKIVN